MGGARSAVSLQSGASTAGTKVSATSMRRSSERKVPAVSGGTLTSSANSFSINTPRQVRVRLSHPGSRRAPRATPRKRPAAGEMMSMNQMPDSPVAVNRGTGRTAVGPWCGPFEMSASAADHEPPSPTLFMDRAGSAHRSLDGAIREHRRSSSPQHQHGPPADHTLAFPAALEFTPSGRRAELKDHSREVHLTASKGSPKGSAEARCAPRFGGGGAKRHAGHQVFQPSGRFY